MTVTVHLKEGWRSAGEQYQWRPWKIQRGDALWDTECGEMCFVLMVETDRIFLQYADGDSTWVLLRQLWDEYQFPV